MSLHHFFRKKGWLTESFPLQLAFFSCMLLPAGMIYSPYLQSLSMFFLGLAALLHLWGNSIMRDFRGLLPFAAVALHFFIALSGILYPVADEGYLLERLRIKTPFLGLALVFWILPPFPRRYYLMLWNFLLLLLAFTSLGIVVNYFLHFGEINLLIRQGQPMPMPCNHIRYSLLQTMGMAGGLYLLSEGLTGDKSFREKALLQLPAYAVGGLTLFLFITQHLIAVRSGLVVAYGILGIAVLREIFVRRKYAAGAVLLIALALAPVLAYQLVPSIQTRIGYMRYDFDLYRKGQDLGTLSDASRWVSWGIGWEIFKSSPWRGVGPGNLRQAVERHYAERYPDFEKRLMPHNQFLHTAAGSGGIGLAVFLGAFLIPLGYRKNWRHFPLLALHLAAFLSFLVESTLESAMGVAFFLFFLMLGLNFMKGKST